MANAIKMEGIVKRFPGVLANDRVTLQINQGEIHALLGENGAGKSTLMNILYGLYRADAGLIYLNDRPVEIRNPKHAIELGISMVHQDFMLVPVFTVAENIILGMETPREPLLDLRQACSRLEEISKAYGLSIDPSAKIWQLSVGTQQRVEIIKALYKGAEVLILDEPTSVLTPGEIDDLFKILRRLRDEGKTVIFITHKLHEVMEISDRITVLRDGCVIGTVETKNVDESTLAKMMVGREVVLKVTKPPASLRQEILSVEDVHVQGDRGISAVNGVSLHVRAGEILGIAGVDGNGQAELAEAIMGLRPTTSGRILLEGQVINGLTTNKIIQKGVALIPPDRKGMSLIGEFTVEENLLLKRWRYSPFVKYFLFNIQSIHKYSDSMINESDIRTPGAWVKVKNLSGGNQQKVVLARELFCKPKLLIAQQPTRGLDVAAIEYVYKRLLQERERGTAIILISTELDEVLSLSDRIVVFYEGKIMGEVDGEAANVHEIGLMMAGSMKNHEQN
ncbi:MAG: ABC transporter ATP-binding protein [Anaerolineaceae bacterium]|nr:ABC transporter ATP-binding protein [Anaerolineaceae bacterium]